MKHIDNKDMMLGKELPTDDSMFYFRSTRDGYEFKQSFFVTVNEALKPTMADMVVGETKTIPSSQHDWIITRLT
jgi:hypothetical protein